MLIIFLYLGLLSSISAQQKAEIYGSVSDENGKPLELVQIVIEGHTAGTLSDKAGKFKLEVPANKDIQIIFNYLGYSIERRYMRLIPGESKFVELSMVVNPTNLPPAEIRGKKDQDAGINLIDPKIAAYIPSPSGGIEAILKTIGTGVSSTNELSSQYSVRGGNFDENLVYVNDIEIYRPFLVRSGQQEGLSFPNSDLIESIEFSAGGFDARYGDKMSSVLDIQYKRPDQLRGSVALSLLGASAHIEGSAKNNRFTYLLGIRQKSNQYVLSSLETKGDYQPSFTDIQSYISYSFTEKFEIGILGNIARNSFKLIPENRQTDFGTINEALRLTIYFDGQEQDKFETYMGAVSTSFKPNNALELKLISSVFRTYESETYDIMGQYWLDQLETNLGKDDFGNVAFNRGVGTYINHARNYLDARVFNLEQRGTFKKGRSIVRWGVKYQNEQINDKVSEWRMLDSAGFSIPHPWDSIGKTKSSQQLIELQEVIKAKHNLNTSRYSGFVQNKWNLGTDSLKVYFIAGVRANYWEYSEQLLFSPRVTFSVKPHWKSNVIFRLSSGIYYQPPFYREFRDFTGKLNQDIKAQRSVHYVAGSEWEFDAWRRPFKFVSEIYYKKFDNLIPYEVDNVRIRYFAKNNAKGYATGIDLKINGEFVKGIESWANLSVMKTAEDIKDDFYYDYYNASGEKIIPGHTLDDIPADSTRFEPGYIPRPSDQRVSFSLFFQDYLPKNPTYKMHLNLVYGTGLPFGPPVHERHKATLRIPPYRRVDLGFSKLLKGENSKVKANNPLKHLNTVWVSLEIFNLLDIRNTISYLWISDVENRLYAVPNYLTSRQINVKLVANF